MNLPRTITSSGVCINYTALQEGDCTIHNQSMMAAAMLAKTAKHTSNAEYLNLAHEAIKYSCTRQLPNAGWYYGEDPKYHWIDNFHTGYNLDALKCYIESTNDKTYEENLCRSLEFLKNNFFEENGRPKYYHNRTYPIDSQCASQAIETLSRFLEYDEEALKLAIKVANWWIDNMQDEAGYFYYRQYPGGIKAKTPMLHWAQATMYKALALLFSKLN